MQRRILIAILGLIATLIILFYVVNSFIFQRSFREYNETHSQAHVELIPSILHLYIDSHGSWEGIEIELVQLSILAGTQVTIVDPNGLVVISTGTDPLGEPLDENQPFSKVISVEKQDGTPVGTAYVALSPDSLTVDQSLSASLNQGVLLSLGVALLAGAFIAGLLARSISAPIVEIEQAAYTIAKGQYDTHVAIPPSNDEVAALAKTFNTMAARLEEHDQMRRDLVANVSHDLRTPLTVLNGYLEGLVNGAIRDRETAGQVFERMGMEVRYMRQLVDSLSISAKWDSGAVTPTQTAVDIYDLVQNVVDRFNLQHDQTSITITNDVPSTVGPFHCDPTMIAQALSNLVDNAISHNNAGVCVQIGGALDNSNLRLWVEDDGIGIPLAQRERIFQRFVRLDLERNRDNSGMGMGLSIVQSLIASHDGRVWVEESSNNGAKFIISLPIYSKSIEKAKLN